MKKAKIIKVAESLPIQTPFEKSIIQYWTGQRYGNINVGLLEKIKLAKQKAREEKRIRNVDFYGSNDLGLTLNV